jgi:hypothetical protein
VETLSLEPSLHASLLQRSPAPAPIGARLVCHPGQAALFVARGKLVGRLDAGEHLLDPRFIAFLGPIAQHRPMGLVAGDDLYWAKIGVSEEVSFGGALPTLLDPAIGERVTPRFNGTLTIRVADFGRAVATTSQRFVASLEREARSLAEVAVAEAFAGSERLVDMTRPESWREREPVASASLRPRLFELGLELALLRIDVVTVPDDVAARLRLLGTGATQLGAEITPSHIDAGARVRTSRAGVWYSGRVGSISNDFAFVAWDGAPEPTRVPLAELELEPAYPGAHRSGTRVFAEHPSWGLSPGMIRAFNGTAYEVEWSDGTAHWLAPGQVQVR